MATSGLKGPHLLTDRTIDEIVTRTSAGTYALGYSNNGSFYIDYTGRSDTDLNDRLHDWVESYKEFKYDYFDSAKSAFERECTIYHDFSPKDNKIHPDRPKNSNWTCPRCRTFG